jgi:hypothetical protein
VRARRALPGERAGAEQDARDDRAACQNGGGPPKRGVVAVRERQSSQCLAADEPGRHGVHVVKPSTRCADGSAMFITVAARITMSCARPITPRMSHRRYTLAPLMALTSVMSFPMWRLD